MSGSAPPDPFNVSGMPEAPANSMGASPDFWRNLMLFGGALSQAANARTPQGFLANGPGFAGPFGAALGQSAASNMDIARNRASVGLANAQAQGVGLENYTKLLNLPVMQARARQQQEYYADPQAYMQKYGFGAQDIPAALGPQSSAQPQGGGVSTGSVLTGIPASPVKLGSVAIPGAAGKISVSADAVQPFQGLVNDLSAAGYNIDPATSGGYNPRNIAGTNTPSQHASGHAIDINWGANPRGKPGDIPPDLARSLAAKWGLTWGGDWSNPDPMHFELKQPQPVQNAQGGNGGAPQPVQIAQAGNGPLPMPSVGGGQAPQGGAPAPRQLAPQVQTQAPPQAQAQSLIATAQHYEQQANQISQMQAYGIPVPGDPAALRQAAQSYRQQGLELLNAGPVAREKAMNSNFDLHAGGMGLVQTPSGPKWIKNPQLEPVQGPNGVTNYVHIAPPPPGSPEGTPGTSTPVLDANGQPAVKQIPKQVQEGYDKSYEEFNGKGADSYVAAKNTQGWLEQMDHAASTLNKAGGFLTTGPTAPERIAFANNVNDVLRTMGLPTVFDPKAIGAWEELKKATTTAGFELSSHYEGHARQAAATIENATSAVPSAANSPIGYYTVSSGIREAAQSAADMREFAQAPVAQKGGDINQAAIDFYKTNTPQMYARRAISNVTPYPVKTDAELARYLPGTFIQYKAKIVQVPERPGAPPIPAYLKGAQPVQVPTQ